jgi:hypothetical protein
MRPLRKTGALDPMTGDVVVIPRLPSITGANKPSGWNRWSPAEKDEEVEQGSHTSRSTNARDPAALVQRDVFRSGGLPRGSPGRQASTHRRQAAQHAEAGLEASGAARAIKIDKPGPVQSFQWQPPSDCIARRYNNFTTNNG